MKNLSPECGRDEGRLHSTSAVQLALASRSPGTQPRCSHPPPLRPCILAAPVELCPLDGLQTGVRTGAGKQTTPQTLSTCCSTRTRTDLLTGGVGTGPQRCLRSLLDHLTYRLLTPDTEEAVIWPCTLSHMLAFALDRLPLGQQVPRSPRLTLSSITLSGKLLAPGSELDIDPFAL